MKSLLITLKGTRICIGLATTALLLCTSLYTFPQREPQNIYRVRVQSRYVLEDGKRTSTFYAVNQQIQDSLGRLHTEIDYDWVTQYPNNYRWHYFDGLTKTKTEHFVNERLSRVEEFGRDSEGRITELRIFNASPADTILQVRVIYQLNPDGTIARATGFNSQGKRGFRATYTHDAKGTEIERRVRGKRVAPPDSIMRLSRVPLYDSLGRMVEEKVTTHRVNGEERFEHYTYTYDDKGNLVSRVSLDRLGNVMERRVYTYRHDNRVQLLERFDGSGNLLEFTAWRYEIYRTSDRRHRTFE